MNTVFSHSLNPAHRDALIQYIQSAYDRFSLETFQLTENGSYPLLGAGIEQPVLDWLYPATHLLLSPRAGREQADRDLARHMVLRCIRQGQVLRNHERDGIWHWSITDEDGETEQEMPTDRNTPGFMGVGLARMWHLDEQHLADWPEEDFAEFKLAMRRSIECATRFPVRIGYTNPQFLDYYLLYVAADVLEDASYREHAREALKKLMQLTALNDGFEEWISPTYTAVNLSALVPLALYTQGSEDEAWIQSILDFQWQQVADYVHAPTAQLSGPHARSYGDLAQERADHTYGWLHYISPEHFPVEDIDPNSVAKFYDWNSAILYPFDGLAAMGIYCPLGLSEKTRENILNDFSQPLQIRRNVEWIAGLNWELSSALTDADFIQAQKNQIGKRFRQSTVYRTNSYCLGSMNELDGWLQRRPLLSYWLDEKSLTTGVKAHSTIVEDEGINGWLAQEAIECISVQEKNTVLGAFKMAPVIAAAKGDRLLSPATIVNSEKVLHENVAAYFLGNHWRQGIPQAELQQNCPELWIGFTPLGNGVWQQYDEQGCLWFFEAADTRMWIETALPAQIEQRANRTRSDQAVDCLSLFSARNIPWNWLELPQYLFPFAISITSKGQVIERQLQWSGDTQACSLQYADLQLDWQNPRSADTTNMPCLESSHNDSRK